jgi:MFS family permease
MIQSVVSVVTPLSLLVAGPLADRMGIQFWYLVSGATMLALGIGGFFVPAVLFVEERAAAHRMRTAEDPPPRVSG